MADAPNKLASAEEHQECFEATSAAPRLEENPRAFTFWQRVQIAAASVAGYLAVWLVGRTLRFEVHGWENWEAARRLGKGLIYTFWHREIFAATWFWRKRGIVVMTSQNFDGEYIARIIQWHGYGAARGSSSRGAGRALVEMIRCHRAGHDTAFTIDGPRGPRYVAKRGSVILSRASGAAILCFHIALRKTFVFRKSWDQTQFPYPFSPAAVFIAPPIVVSPDADETEQDAKQQEVQLALDELRSDGEKWLAKIED
jgi:lysophospholipid acyltransferase (LPLAT)-like uncharacterized protein